MNFVFYLKLNHPVIRLPNLFDLVRLFVCRACTDSLQFRFEELRRRPVSRLEHRFHHLIGLPHRGSRHLPAVRHLGTLQLGGEPVRGGRPVSPGKEREKCEISLTRDQPLHSFYMSEFLIEKLQKFQTYKL